MKKLIALCLLLCTVLALLPAVWLAASGTDGTSEAPSLTYNDLYIKDGLAVHLVADEESVDLSTGTWASKVGEISATVHSGATKWQLTENGLSYRYASLTEYAAGRNTVGIDLPGSVIGDGEFTAEIVFTPK